MEEFKSARSRLSAICRGYRGRITNATETHVRMELEAQYKTVTVPRTVLPMSDGGVPESVANNRRPYNPPTTPGYNAPQTPAYAMAGSQTPMHSWGGSRTPRHPGMTPSHPGMAVSSLSTDRNHSQNLSPHADGFNFRFVKT